MQAYFAIFGSVSVPILMACLLGYLYQAFKSPDTKMLADLSLFVLSPCLIVGSLAGSSLDSSSFGHIALFTALQTALCWAASLAAGKALRFDRSSLRSMEMTTIFANSNNYGLPLLLLAFGTEGFAIGVTNVVLHIVLVNTLGLYISSRSSFSPRQAAVAMARNPLIYAAAVGLLLYALRIPLPDSLADGFRLIGGAYAAVVLLILGMQLRKANWRSGMRRELWIAVAMRIAGVPLLSWLTISLLGLRGLEASVLFVQSSMPSAINSVVMMEKYGGDPEMTALNVAITTVASFLYLPLIIHWAHGF
ncbi:AEC family transporter [Paenibacillus sp. MWE-103]|uniref:AEC family transporter n=1 Tax=Paenibacillus artemisiicola TaxID=1172618 RepID=A0ABS3W381_9BACL|nr:AEC family transporter [Paenibacillus artemisiicola]MBO7742756.1 AEC family transporter [Paenibacillus artemisiicola]